MRSAVSSEVCLRLSADKEEMLQGFPLRRGNSLNASVMRPHYPMCPPCFAPENPDLKRPAISSFFSVRVDFFSHKKMTAYYLEKPPFLFFYEKIFGFIVALLPPVQEVTAPKERISFRILCAALPHLEVPLCTKERAFSFRSYRFVRLLSNRLFLRVQA